MRPYRRVIATDTRHGARVETLECGHVLARGTDTSTALYRRCRLCRYPAPGVTTPLQQEA